MKVIVGCCIMLLTGSVMGQDKNIQLNSWSLQSSFTYHPSDFYSNYGVGLRNSHLEHNLEIGFGIRRTLFQGQFSPRIAYSIGYDFEPLNQLHLEPQFKQVYTVVSVKTSMGRVVQHSLQPYLAGKISYGNFNRIFVSAGIGPAFLINNSTTFFDWNYCVEIGYRYVFHQ